MFGKVHILLLACFAGIFCTETCLKPTGEVCVFDFQLPCNDPASKCMEKINICCITDPAQNCDNIFNDSTCESNAAKCNVDAVSKVCPKTCKACVSIGNPPPPPCVDKVGPNGANDCVKDAYLCNNAQYFDLMTQLCPKTCNRCPGVAPPPAGSPSAPPCVDKVGPNGQSDCAKDAYLCNNAQYFDLMTQQCPKTCGRC